MLRFVFRALSFLCLCLAVIVATVDSIESVSISQVTVSPLSTTWAEASPASLIQAQSLVEVYAGKQVWQIVSAWLLPQPAFAVLLLLALLLWMVGYKKPSPAGRFAA
ncbi:hypothetical protein NBH19_13425 [Rhizobium sp. S95]|uniref:Uncharacterized protein n=1 Tax=Ciceribacter sichuanensis TaxID=2949647 RepID=A0AAJ1BX15_9HYPH|nr:MULTISPECIES: hypothetical protein [unclassified Ciceribacter]MCM2397072.1 hypothetical protein [Ciceribacter sp. S95]MCM2401460.1 hypothetical protein [Ciceribacter sp. S153]MCO5957836.1 hypothetical protein [Ciceribacter sp. S101]